MMTARISSNRPQLPSSRASLSHGPSSSSLPPSLSSLPPSLSSRTFLVIPDLPCHPGPDPGSHQKCAKKLVLHIRLCFLMSECTFGAFLHSRSASPVYVKGIAGRARNDGIGHPGPDPGSNSLRGAPLKLPAVTSFRSFVRQKADFTHNHIKLPSLCVRMAISRTNRTKT